MEILTTVLLGVGTVFAGLVVIILLVMLLRLFAGNKQENPAPVAVPAAAPAAPQKAEIANRQEFVAAVSAVALSDDQKTRLTEKLCQMTGATIQLTNRVDPECLGGIRLDLDGKRLDDTVAHRLQEIRELLQKTVL